MASHLAQELATWPDAEEFARRHPRLRFPTLGNEPVEILKCEETAGSEANARNPACSGPCVDRPDREPQPFGDFPGVDKAYFPFVLYDHAPLLSGPYCGV